MKVLAGTIAGFMVAATLSVATAPANAAAPVQSATAVQTAAAPYTPTIRTFANGRQVRSKARRARIILRIAANSRANPHARVRITFRNRNGRVVRRTWRQYSPPRGNWRFKLPPGRYTVSIVAIMKNDRFYDATDRFGIRVKAKKRRRR